MQTRRAFSLTEVLIVTAIVAILAGIAYSVFSPAREKGRQTVCVSNLHTIYKALTMYATDNAGHDHLAGLEDIPLEPFGRSRILSPYIANSEALFCPDTPSNKRDGWASSYNWLLYPRNFGDKNDERLQRQRKKQAAQIARLGTSMPIVRCYNHQKAYYEQKQQSTDIALRKQYVIDLLASGGTKTHLIGPNE